MSGKAYQKGERDGSYSRSEAAKEAKEGINFVSTVIKEMMDNALAQERREIARIVQCELNRFAIDRWGHLDGSVQSAADRSHLTEILKLDLMLHGMIVGRSAEGGE